METSRRNFLKSAGFGAATVAGAAVAAPLASTALAVSPDAIEWADQAEVVVVGCGTGGAPAAIEAGRAGADVLVIEKADWLGGCMRRCAGGIFGHDTLVQRALDVDDTDEQAFRDYVVATQGDYYDADLLETFMANCGPNVDWIVTPVEEGGLGGQPVSEWGFATDDDGESGTFNPGLCVGGPSDGENQEKLGFGDTETRRTHWFTPNPDDVEKGEERKYSGVGWGGTGLWKPFEDVLTGMGNVRIQTETTLCGIVMSDKGEAIGVKVAPANGGDERYIKATKGVVIATGTYVLDKDLFENFTGKVYNYPDDPKSVASIVYLDYQADGAGVKALLGVGAAPRFIFKGEFGGVRINPNAEVVDTYGEVIPRLYACGRTTGGITSCQCGTPVAISVCFGRIAGQNAAALEAWE